MLNVVDVNPGLTIIPEMHAMALPEDRQDSLREFKDTIAVREVILLVNKNNAKLAMQRCIIDIVKESVPKSMLNPDLKKYVTDF